MCGSGPGQGDGAGQPEPGDQTGQAVAARSGLLSRWARAKRVDDRAQHHTQEDHLPALFTMSSRYQ